MMLRGEIEQPGGPSPIFVSLYKTPPSYAIIYQLVIWLRFRQKSSMFCQAACHPTSYIFYLILRNHGNPFYTSHATGNTGRAAPSTAYFDWHSQGNDVTGKSSCACAACGSNTYGGAVDDLVVVLQIPRFCVDISYVGAYLESSLRAT